MALTIATPAQPLRSSAAHWTDAAPIIDGKLDDPGWRLAPEEGGFVKVGDWQARVRAQTYLRVLSDGKALYLGFRCVEPEMRKVILQQKNHDDPVWTDDSLEIILDPDNRRTKLYHLIINSAGVQYDAVGKISLPETSNEDSAWNGKWEAACSRGRGEWYAELRLPFEAFGVSATNGACIGFNAGRGRLGARREESSWAPTQIEYVNPAYLGEVYLPDGQRQAVRVALSRRPDVVTGTTRIALEFANPNPTPSSVRWTASFDGAVKSTAESDLLTLPAKGSCKTSIPFIASTIGDDRLHLTVYDGLSGRTLYRSVRCFKVLPEIGISQSLYALQYARAQATVQVHLPPEATAGSQLELGLYRRGEPVPRATQTRGVRTGASNTVAFSLRDQEAGDYVLRARLRKQREVLSSCESLPFPYLPNPAVGFHTNGFLRVEGKPWFPVGMYTLQAREGSHDAIMEEARQAGFNTTVFYAYTIETVSPLLDAAARHGLRAFVYPANPFRVREHTATKEELVREVQARKRHPALLGWYLVDEPEGIGVSSVETVRDYYQLVKETDPSHPCSLVIMSPGAAARYGDSADIVWIDPYPVPHSPVTLVSESVDGALASAAKDKPVWAIPQAFDWNVWNHGHIDKIHRPTPEEERCMTYLALVHGAKGIIFWAHTASKYYIRDYPEHWAAMKRIAGELRELSPALLTVNSSLHATVSPRTAPVDLMVKEADGWLYCFAVNREQTEFSATLSLRRAKTAPDVEVLFEQRTLACRRSSWTDHFRPLEVHAYRVRLR